MAPREVIVLPVRYAVGTHAVQATTRALNLEGAYIRASAPPRPGVRVAVRVYFPEGPSEDVTAQVADWAGPAGEGGFWARFESVGERLRERILEVLGPAAAEAAQAARTASSAGRPRPATATHPGVRPPTPPQAPAARAREGIEDRRSVRVAARLPVRFQTVSALREEMSLNVSAGGMFIRTDQPPPLRELVLVAIELPGEGAPIEVQAEVVHRVTAEDARRTGQQPGAGVQFVAADDRFRERLDAFLARTR